MATTSPHHPSSGLWCISVGVGVSLQTAGLGLFSAGQRCFDAGPSSSCFCFVSTPVRAQCRRLSACAFLGCRACNISMWVDDDTNGALHAPVPILQPGCRDTHIYMHATAAPAAFPACASSSMSTQHVGAAATTVESSCGGRWGTEHNPTHRTTHREPGSHLAAASV